jgi:hypothetical protein
VNRAFALLVLAWLSVLPTAPAADITNADFAVWRVDLSSALPQQPEGRVYIWRVVERSEVYDYGAMQGFRSSMRLLTEQLFRGYNDRNDLRPPLELTDRFELPVPVTLFGQEDAQKHLGRHLNPGWWLHPSRLPDACLVARLSLPAYSPDRKTAFVFAALYAPTRADQTYFILRRTKDSWRVAERKTWWQSDTPDYTSTQ